MFAKNKDSTDFVVLLIGLICQVCDSFSFLDAVYPCDFGSMVRLKRTMVYLTKTLPQ